MENINDKLSQIMYGEYNRVRTCKLGGRLTDRLDDRLGTKLNHRLYDWLYRGLYAPVRDRAHIHIMKSTWKT